MPDESTIQCGDWSQWVIPAGTYQRLYAQLASDVDVDKMWVAFRQAGLYAITLHHYSLGNVYSEGSSVVVIEGLYNVETSEDEWKSRINAEYVRLGGSPIEENDDASK